MIERRLEFDPNIVHNGLFSTLNDHELALSTGDNVTIYEPEDDIQAPAIVQGFWGPADKYVLLAVDWNQISAAGDSGG